MKSIQRIVLAVVLIVTAYSMAAPPAGYNWVPVDEFSDEFNGTSLDTSKWRDYHPYWSGRDSTHEPFNVSVSAGDLRLVSSLYPGSTEVNANTITAACVSSQNRGCLPGYYEARIQASSLSMTSAFWFQGNPTEIDVIENIGDASNAGSTWIENTMMMNTHYYPDGFNTPTHVKTPEHWTMSSLAREEYHIYGVWWKDENIVWFYHNDVKVAEVTPGGSFNVPQYMFFDTEVFTWHGWPTMESLLDPSKNTMYVDWVRAWEYGGLASPVIITESGGSTDFSEEGPTSDTYTVVLELQPTYAVIITIDPDIDTEVNGAGAGNSVDLTFLTTDWDTEQTVTVTAIDDADIEGSHISTITHTASSTDPAYSGINVSSVIANITDNESTPDLFTDPGFESGTLNAWNDGWGTRDISSTEQNTGSYCGHVSNGAVTQLMSLEPHTTYTYSGYVKSSGGTVYLGVKDHGNTETATSTTSTTYQYLSVEFTTGTDPSASKLYVWCGPGTDGYADDLELVDNTWDCGAAIVAGHGMTGDLSGPTGVPDCYVDVYDLVKMSEMWLTSKDLDDFAALAGQWLQCNDPLDGSCTYSNI